MALSVDGGSRLCLSAEEAHTGTGAEEYNGLAVCSHCAGWLIMLLYRSRILCKKAGNSPFKITEASKLLLWIELC